jgi:hypothetical protein
MIKLINILKKINEGLIKTTPINQAIKIIDKEVNNFKNVNLYSEGGMIFLEYEPEYTSDTFDFSKINKVLTLVNNLGYFPSMFTYFDDNDSDFTEKYTPAFFKDVLINEKPKSIFLQFEAKYDVIVDVPKYVYHITSTYNINKIKKIGLTPKTQSKISTHPDRIYVSLSEEYSNEIYWQIRGDFRNHTGIELVIDTSQLDQSFYEDPNFQTMGVYTYKNIPPQAIVQYRAIEEIPEEGKLIRKPL